MLAVLCALVGYEWFNRHRVEQSMGLMGGLMASSSAKVSVAQYYQMEGELPRSNEDAGLPPAHTYVGGALVGLEVIDEGVVVLTFNEKSGVKDGRVVLTPDVGNGAMGIRWECETSDYANVGRLLPGCVYID